MIPLPGGLLLWTGLVLTAIQDWKPVNSYVVWVMHFAPHWQLGFAFLLGVGSVLVGLVLMAISIPIFRPYFSGQTLNRDTPVHLTEGEPLRPDTPPADSAANPARPPEGARD